MAVDESRHHNSALAVELLNFAPVLLQPGIAQQGALRPGGDDIAAATQHCGIFHHADFGQRSTASRAQKHRA